MSTHESIVVHLKIKLLVEGPILSGSTALQIPGIDAAMARDGNGDPYLPYSLVKGKLRQSWHDFGDAMGQAYGSRAPNPDELLGPKPRSNDPEGIDSNGPHWQLGRLRFTDFVQKDHQIRRDSLITRIHIDEKSLAAAQGQLQVIESCFAAGEQVPFEGTIRFVAHDLDEVEPLTKLIVAGLKYSPNYGAEKSIGFGRTLDAHIEQLQLWSMQSAEQNLRTLAQRLYPQHQVSGKESINSTSRPSAITKYPFALNVHAPFVLGWRQSSGNIFESEESISGAVLKGILAEVMRQLTPGQRTADVGKLSSSTFPALQKHFSKLRLSHAFPTDKTKQPLQRAVQVPQSLVNGNVDVSHFKSVNEYLQCHDSAVRFQTDWKSDDWGTAGQLFPYPDLERELRVRTQIDPDKRRAKDENLFAYEMIRPDGLCWTGWIDVTDIPEEDRCKLLDEIDSLSQSGMLGLGKTKAACDWSILQDLESAHPSTPLTGSETRYVLTLQTSALLCDPRPLSPEKLAQAQSPQQALFDEYQKCFHQLSDGCLKLSHFFATQSLAGGFLHWRYRHGQVYNPWLLTDAGSVFVLEPSENESGRFGTAHEVIQLWNERGIPVPANLLQVYCELDVGMAHTEQSEVWDACPFIPHNGYGEVTVNLDCQMLRENQGGL